MKNSIISIKKFSKSFAHLRAVDNLSFEVFEGETFAFLGSNGSGKTTTIRCLLDIYKSDSGNLEIFNQKYSHKLNHRIGYLPEERGLYKGAKLERLFIYFARLRGIDKKTAQHLTQQYLSRVNLWNHRDKTINQLSSGMQQKAQIGIAVIHKPEVLILDEPFKGLDPMNRQLFIDMFQEMKEAGVTILYSTHVIDEAQKLADRLIIIREGRCKAYGTVRQVRKQFGSNNIQIEFTGRFVKNEKMYSSRIVNKTAELSPVKGVSTDEILKFLIKEKMDIISFGIDYPSLNDVFLEIMGNNNM